MFLHKKGEGAEEDTWINLQHVATVSVRFANEDDNERLVLTFSAVDGSVLDMWYVSVVEYSTLFPQLHSYGRD
jgi:hypothetical protein